ncbi:MAG TPA: multiheme c-type cytochrome [Thermodesulfobacteriota bacterium]|nr:multiheme c-type cytochrome [Thermodesulfobacteriota bacterium]
MKRQRVSFSKTETEEEEIALKKIKLYLPVIYATLFFSSFYPAPIASQDSFHKKIILKGYDGTPLTLESKIPYSPKKTCGSCHNYDQITKGYHFQQGRTDGAGKIVVHDGFDPKAPWNLSSGMYGRAMAASMDLCQLAKKVNASPSEIDKSSFLFVQVCGGCHPGGGWSEYDRKGHLYYDPENKKFGYEDSGENPLLDGDYTPYPDGDTEIRAPWDQSGVSEADCLFCHLKGYLWKEREATLRGKFFKYGPIVGAGWAEIKLSHDESGNSKADEIIVDYAKKEVADFENLNAQIIKSPPDENCWSCHAMADGKRRGRQWSSETDVHNAKGLHCLSCHPGNKDHNFAKGDTIQQRVRSDLNYTMVSCEDCHYKGKSKNAPKFRHPFSPRHLKKISCQTCHIPFQTASADLVYDFSSGRPLIYETFRFLSSDPLDPKKAAPGKAPNTWYPALTKWKGKIVPVKSLVVLYWGDLDPRTNAVKPIALWKIQGLKKPPLLKDDDGDGVPEVNSLEEIKAFLKALEEKDKFENPVADHPVLMKGGFLYQLDKKGEVEKIKHEQADVLDFSLSHNVVSGPNVLGAQGCKECHSEKSSFFRRKVLIDPWDEKGKPVYVENWERLGIDQEKLSQLLMEQ